MASTGGRVEPTRKTARMTCMAGIYAYSVHLPMPAKNDFLRTDEEAGGRGGLRRRRVVRFRGTAAAALTSTSTGGLAQNRREFAPAGPILDLACGTGRLLLPLLRDGHMVLGLDRSASMAGCGSAPGRPPACHPPVRAACSCGRTCAPLPCSRASLLAVAAFHSVQHLYAEAESAAFSAGRACLSGSRRLAGVRRVAADPAWIERDPLRRWGRTLFRHPGFRAAAGLHQQPPVRPT